MSRKQLSEAVSKHVSLPKSDAKALVDAFFAQIQGALQRGESVVIREFGSFYPTPDDEFGSKAAFLAISGVDLGSGDPVFKPGKPLIWSSALNIRIQGIKRKKPLFSRTDFWKSVTSSIEEFT